MIWHDLPEARIGDLDKVAIRYIPNKQEAEQNALRAQMEGVDFGEEILSLIQEMDEKVTLEGKIAKDADYLEAAFQAKKYLELGHTMAQNHMDNVWNALRTESGKLLFAEMKNTHSTDRRHKASLQDLSKV